MAIRHKRKSTSGYSWLSTDLVEGQVGLNIVDGTLHFKKTDNSVVTLQPNRASAGDNTDITSLTGLTGGISTADYVTFDTVNAQTTGVGKLFWDDATGTLDLGLKGGNVNLYLGQAEVLMVYNGTTSPLTKGQIVYVVGAQGNTLSVELASSADEAKSSVTMGMVAEPIAVGASGFITTSGLIGKMDTVLDTAGSAVWLGSTPGTWTTTKPIPPNHAVLIGYIVRSHQTVGSIFVKVQNGYELNELHNVLIGATPSTGDLLTYNGTTGLWVNSAKPSYTLDNLSDVVISSPTNNQVIAYNSTTGLWVNVDQTGGGGGSSLPSQTGNGGKFLTTDGATPSWAVIVNDASTTSTTLGWSASKLNTTLGDISSALAIIIG